jgi:HEAT repeat protein
VSNGGEKHRGLSVWFGCEDFREGIYGNIEREQIMKKSVSNTLKGLVLLVLLFVSNSLAEDKTAKILADIEACIKAEDSDSTGLSKSIAAGIEESPEGVAKALIEKIETPGLSEEALNIYVWAIGFTRDANAVDTLIKISKESKSELVKGNAISSLGNIGGTKAGEYLLSLAREANDRGYEEEKKGFEKFNILDCLARMQYAPALPEMEGLLKKDYDKYYWQCYFCFGKMGNAGVPFLLKRINDNDRNVRLASIWLLGGILIDTEAAKPLREHYRKEKDAEVRNVTLSSLEKVIYDFREMETFFKDVISKEKNEACKRFATETIATLEKYRQMTADAKKDKKENRKEFEAAYKTIYKSYGLDRGSKPTSYEALMTYSRPEDEARLKKLRERILCRNSDECFYDYEKVNRIIMINRFISKSE